MALGDVFSPEPQVMEGSYSPPQRVVIASVYPREMVTTFSRRSPQHRFVIPAGTREKPGICVIEDTYESSGTLDRPNQVRILAEHTAQDILQGHTLKVWGIDAANRSWPGIFICAGMFPTMPEIDDALECQERFMHDVANVARALHRDKRFKEIHDIPHRMAAKYLGITEEWTGSITGNSTKACRWCKVKIDSAAAICEKCGKFQTVEHAEEYSKIAAASQPAQVVVMPPQVPVTQESDQKPNRK